MTFSVVWIFTKLYHIPNNEAAVIAFHHRGASARHASAMSRFRAVPIDEAIEQAAVVRLLAGCGVAGVARCAFAGIRGAGFLTGNSFLLVPETMTMCSSPDIWRQNSALSSADRGSRMVEELANKRRQIHSGVAIACPPSVCASGDSNVVRQVPGVNNRAVISGSQTTLREPRSCGAACTSS